MTASTGIGRHARPRDREATRIAGHGRLIATSPISRKSSKGSVRGSSFWWERWRRVERRHLSLCALCVLLGDIELAKRHARRAFAARKERFRDIGKRTRK